MSRSAGWRRVPEWCGVDSAGSGAGDKESGVGYCAGT